MSEFKFGYKSPTHEVNLQIPVSLLGIKESGFISNLKEVVGKNEEPTPEVEEKKTGKFFHKKKEEKEAAAKKDEDGITLATGVLLLSSMILAAVKN